MRPLGSSFFIQYGTCCACGASLDQETYIYPGCKRRRDKDLRFHGLLSRER